VPYTASGTNTYTVTFTGITNIKSGDEFRITFTNGNTAASTINGTALVKNPTTALTSGDLAAGGTYIVRYTGTNFQVLNIAGSGGGGGGISGLTSGRVVVATSATTIGDDENLVWEGANKRLDLRTGSRIRFQRNDNALNFEMGIIDPIAPNDFIINAVTSPTGFQFQQAGTTTFGITNLQRFNFNNKVFFNTFTGSALADFQSTNQGLVLPRALRSAITTPENGMLTVDTNVPYFHDGTGWDRLLESTSPPITTSITTPSTSFDLLNTTATTVNAFGQASTLTIGATAGTLNLRNVTLTAPNATSFAMNGASPSITTTNTGTASLFNTAALTGNLFGAATTMNIGGTPTTAITHNYSSNATATGTTKTVNLATGGAAGSTTNVNIGSATASAVLGNLTLGFPTIVQPTNYTSLNLFNTQSTTVNFAGAATTFTLGGTPTTSLTANLFANATATGQTKTINIGTGGVASSTTNINIGSTNGGQINLNRKVVFQATETPGGTTGNQTINLPSGSVNFAAGATSIVVTNSLATTTSHIFCTLETNDATAVIKNVVRASGSFTINLNAAATAETRVGFLVIN
jgi:hypothetical protein